MWIGLQSLKSLSLNHNHMIQIPHHGLSNMPALENLALSSNHLTNLAADIFNPNDYPDSNGYPPLLRINLSDNPVECDSGLCWLINVSNTISVTFSKNGPCALNNVDLRCASGE